MVNIVEAILQKKATKIKRYPCHTNRASSMGYCVPELGGCVRRGVYERTNWQDAELVTPETQLIFDEGNNQEDIVLRDLIDAGVQIIGQQTPYAWEAYQITGSIDGKIVDDGVAVPLEIKSMSPNIFSGIKTLEDFKKKPWTRAYLAQITLYMLMQNCDKAIFLLKNKSTGELKQVDVSLDYELGEACLRTATQINEHVKNKTLPDRITDREVCKNCRFKLLCLPEISFGEELKIEQDPEFESRIKRYLELKENSAECDKVYEVIKDRAKASANGGALNVLVGTYSLVGKTASNGSFRFDITEL